MDRQNYNQSVGYIGIYNQVSTFSQKSKNGQSGKYIYQHNLSAQLMYNQNSQSGKYIHQHNLSAQSSRYKLVSVTSNHFVFASA